MSQCETGHDPVDGCWRCCATCDAGGHSCPGCGASIQHRDAACAQCQLQTYDGVSVEVTIGDPLNDQAAAHYGAELDRLLVLVRRLRAQAQSPDGQSREAELLAAMSVTLEHDTNWSRQYFASILAVAMIRLTRESAP